MRTLPVALSLAVAVAACRQPAAPAAALAGTWTIDAPPRLALEPVSLTLREFGPVVSGTAVVAGLDPVNLSDVPSVSGGFAAPTAALDVTTAEGYAVHFAATLDGSDHLSGILTFTGTAGSGVDTVGFSRR